MVPVFLLPLSVHALAFIMVQTARSGNHNPRIETPEEYSIAPPFASPLYDDATTRYAKHAGSRQPALADFVPPSARSSRCHTSPRTTRARCRRDCKARKRSARTNLPALALAS